ncbi:MAG: nitroreductase family protein [Peptococcaceae bacterium]|nr:nitroreductase family protein [Peptococcaceae bacterium]
MNEIFHRVSIRKYQDKPVRKADLMQILRAGMQAPSATNQQPWEFYVVSDKALLKALSEASPYAAFTKDAPVAIVACYRKDCRVPVYADIDMSIAMENIWLETDHLGLGGCWIGISPIEERMQAVEKILDIPSTLRAFAIYPLGHPAETRTQQDRFEENRIHWIGEVE